ncbi:MBL fold metallo-hydrolase [Sphingomonas crocodyli]|nr:MBL fold metallo-hydrolase [Sphingomonas crocodyli]
MDVVKDLVAKRPDMWALQIAREGQRFQINDFIHCVPSVSNVYLIKTAEGDIQINAGMGFEAPTIAKELAPVRSGPLPYLILTQGHVDHVGGVAQLRQPETKVIAQKNNADCQADDQRIKTVRNIQSSTWFPMQTATLHAPNTAPMQDVPKPDILVDDRLDLTLGGLDLELLSVPGGETVDSLAIHLPQHRIVFTGNMFGPLFPHFPNLCTIRGDRYRFAEPYLSSLRRVRDLEPELLITGHFEPIVGRDLIRTCLDRLHDAVSYVHQTTLDGMNAGKDIFTLMREVKLPDHLYVGEGYGKISFVVRTVWEQYMGWFKARATSEMYAAQPADIYADLAALAGVDAVVALGRSKFDAGDPETAQLLAEVALAKAPDDRGALALSLDAHRALLVRTDPPNFWEAGWLRAHVAKLEKAVGGAA